MRPNCGVSLREWITYCTSTSWAEPLIGVQSLIDFNIQSALNRSSHISKASRCRRTQFRRPMKSSGPVSTASSASAKQSRISSHSLDSLVDMFLDSLVDMFFLGSQAPWLNNVFSPSFYLKAMYCFWLSYKTVNKNITELDKWVYYSVKYLTRCLTYMRSFCGISSFSSQVGVMVILLFGLAFVFPLSFQ